MKTVALSSSPTRCLDVRTQAVSRAQHAPVPRRLRGAPPPPSSPPGMTRSNVVVGPGAEIRESATARKELQQVALDKLRSYNSWWESSEFFRCVTTPQELKEAVTAARPGQLVVVDYFAPDCPGCRSLHPKLCSIASQKTDAIFIQVNVTTPEMRSLCDGMGISSIPWFQLFVSGGLRASFTANLTTLSRLRAEMARAVEEGDAAQA